MYDVCTSNLDQTSCEGMNGCKYQNSICKFDPCSDFGMNDCIEEPACKWDTDNSECIYDPCSLNSGNTTNCLSTPSCKLASNQINCEYDECY